MNSTKKTTQKTSGIHKIKLGQYDFCMELPIGLSIKPIKKHKG